jgi:hypothetical protein
MDWIFDHDFLPKCRSSPRPFALVGGRNCFVAIAFAIMRPTASSADGLESSHSSLESGITCPALWLGHAWVGDVHSEADYAQLAEVRAVSKRLGPRPAGPAHP